MRIERIGLHNFKRFRDLEIPVRNSLTGDVAEQFLILGDNGTGKTTVLQAVALALSMASRRTRSVLDFNWLGWVAGRYEQWGRPVVELDVLFSDQEIAATREAARRWFDLSSRASGRESASAFVEPGDSRKVALRLEGDRYSAGTREEALQFRGRWYAMQTIKTDPSARTLFASLPGVFWFDQFRNLATPPAPLESEEENGTGGRVSFSVGVARLREFLNRWQLGRISGARRYAHDYLEELETHYKRVFPGRSFSGPEPMYRGGAPTPTDYYFTLSDGNRTYDLEEMSAGEQSVFPMLYEFVRQQIKSSVVLIDEIDLNLHPPLAQALLVALPALGPDCQFLLTTHSEAISAVVSPGEVRRLAGGRLCL